ncbi:TolC family protein [Maridesulfovibrio bastinii]|uniref:TolC family protein n=1 Tax=Maridesulfovibrio bastinii TaxID=47157 RepID=UPI00041CF71F|nr:TolC family protein [Maridesulfovibrio bastinii]
MSRSYKHKFIYCFLIASLALVYSPNCIYADDSGSSSLNGEAVSGDTDSLKSLRNYLVEAARSNDQLYSAFYAWKSALQREGSVSSLPDPRFNFGWFIQPVETRTGPQEFKYGLSQTLPWFGKLGLRGEKALKSADIQKAKFDDLKLKIFYKVKTAYYDYAYLAQAIKVTKEYIALMEYLENVARARYSAGTGGYDGVIKTQVELGKLQNRLDSLNAYKEPTIAKLLSVINSPADRKLPMPENIPVMVIKPKLDELKSIFKSGNPRLKALDHKIDMEKIGVQLAEKDYFPDFTFGLDYIQTGKSRSPNVTNSKRDPIVAGMSVNLPIWFDKQEAQLSEAKNSVRAAKRARSGLERDLEADLELEVYRYQDAIRKVNLYHDTLTPKAEQSLGVTIEAFQSGSATSSDLIDAERTLIEFNLSYYRALAEQAKKVAAIEYLVGREIPCSVHGQMLPSVYPRDPDKQ